VINCTGPATNPVGLEDPLKQHLLERGLATPDPLGLDFTTRAGGRLVDAQANASARVSGQRYTVIWTTTCRRSTHLTLV
jgi:hypothetical protein